MLFQFLSRHICRIVVVEMMIYAGDVLYVIEHFGYIMAYDDDCALPVDLFQTVENLLVLCRGVSRKETFGLAES